MAAARPSLCSLPSSAATVALRRRLAKGAPRAAPSPRQQGRSPRAAGPLLCPPPPMSPAPLGAALGLLARWPGRRGGRPGRGAGPGTARRPCRTGTPMAAPSWGRPAPLCLSAPPRVPRCARAGVPGAPRVWLEQGLRSRNRPGRWSPWRGRVWGIGASLCGGGACGPSGAPAGSTVVVGGRASALEKFCCFGCEG